MYAYYAVSPCKEIMFPDTMVQPPRWCYLRNEIYKV